MRESYWKRVHEVVGHILPRLPSMAKAEIPPYRYDAEQHHPSFWFERIRKPTVRGFPVFAPKRTMVMFSSGCRMEALQQLLVHVGKRRWSLTPDSIWEEPSSDTGYPHYHYCWAWERSGQGRLQFLRVDIAARVFVIYSGEEMQLQKQGTHPYLARIPRSIQRSRALFGIPIPWSIDFQKESEKIVRMSELEIFAQVLFPSHTAVLAS